jgi:hypothetical protein
LFIFISIKSLRLKRKIAAGTTSNSNYILMKNVLLTTAFFIGLTISMSAQPYYLRGEASPCDWGNSSAACQLLDPQNDGIFELTYNFGAAPIGRKEFKIYNAGNNTWWPGGSNAWFNHQGGSVTFRFNSTNNQIEAVEGSTFSICAPGEFSAWNNSTPMVNNGGGQWCYTIPTAGSYQWKPVYCGSFDSWEPTTGERNVNSSNWLVTTTSNNQQFCVTYNAATGKIIPPAPPTGIYLRGTGAPCDWNNVSPGCELKDPDGNGVFELVIDFGSTPIGRQEFKIYNAATNTWYPAGGNSWYLDLGGPVTFRYYSATQETEVVDGFTPTICSPGEFSNWNNADPMTHQGYGIWCRTIPTPGTYQWKPTVCGSWDSWQMSSGERSSNSDNWSITTTTPNQQVCVTYFPSSGQVVPGAITQIPTMTEWGLFLLCLIMLIVGIVTLRQRKLVLAGTQTASFSFRSLPFDKAIFTKAMLIVGIGLVVIFSVAVYFGYELTNADIPGSLVSLPLLSYLVMLLTSDEK